MADKTQIHRVELVVQLDDRDVGEWVDEIYELTNNVVVDVTSNPIKVISSDTTPLDIESPENKWIKDILDAS
jgi:hypothetical protein|tara:strand:- start:286 stop:501 length:216 start_codon:yes stop_codon:yes gene_type:complete